MELKDIEKWILSEIKNSDYQPGDKFISESQIVKELDASRMFVRQVIEKLKFEGVFYIRKGKSLIISKLAFYIIERSQKSEEKLDNSIFLRTSTSLPKELIEEFDFAKEIFSEKDVLGYIRIKFDPKDNEKVVSYSINWINIIGSNNMNSTIIDTKTFKNTLNKDIYLKTTNTFSKVAIEKETSTDKQFFKVSERKSNQVVPTVYYCDYNEEGTVIRMGIKKYANSEFDLNFISGGNREIK